MDRDEIYEDDVVKNVHGRVATVEDLDGELLWVNLIHGDGCEEWNRKDVVEMIEVSQWHE